MKQDQRTDFSERLKTASDARTALLAKFTPKAAVTSAEPPDRAAQRRAELERVRQERTDVKVARREAAAEAVDAAKAADDAREGAVLETKRTERKERKERKALTKTEAKAKRDARYAARKARN